MPVALHVAADDGAVEHVEGGEQRGGAVPLVVVGHGAGAALLHRQAGLGAVERLDLALLVDRQHDGVRRRIDVEADDVAQLVDELRIVGELELPHPVRLQAVRAPDALHRADADAGRLGHHGGGPVGRLARRVGQASAPPRARPPRRRAAGCARAASCRAAGRRRPLRHEALLPAPDAGLRLAGPAHDLVGAEPVGRQQHDLGPPDVLLGGVAIPHQRLEAARGRTARRRWRSRCACARLARANAHGNPIPGFKCQILSTSCRPNGDPAVPIVGTGSVRGRT